MDDIIIWCVVWNEVNPLLKVMILLSNAYSNIHQGLQENLIVLSWSVQLRVLFRYDLQMLTKCNLKAQIESQDDVAYFTTVAPDIVVCHLFS